MSYRDIEALLCQHLETVTGHRTVTELFTGFEQVLPVVLVQTLPSAAKHHPFNGIPLTDSVDLDIDVFASSPEAVFDVCNQLRDELLSWLPGGVTVTERSRFSKRPDHNPNIRKRGGVYTVTAQRR